MRNNKFAIEMINITKKFGDIVANENINLKVKKGEIHALVGENGAGKSTLMSVLFGLYQPTSGSININGESVIISNPIKANRLGIGMVHQHFKLVQVNTVLENIILGAEESKSFLFVNKTNAKQKLNEIMNKYNLNVNLNEKIENISVGMQQRVEILKILYRGADILVFDEPTAVLTPSEIDGLLKIMLELKKDGKTIVFITHKMDEIKKVADTATIIRLGKNICELDVKKVTPQEIAEAMVGRKIVESKNSYSTFKKENPILDIVSLTAKKDGNSNINALQNFSIKVHRGEIVAVAGVEGNGQRELVESIVGLVKPVSGGILFNGILINGLSIKKRYELGMSHIPEDRHKHGIVLDLDCSDNIILSSCDNKEFSNLGLLKANEISFKANEVISKYDVRGTREGRAIARGLSGGNQQKLIVGREISKPHDLLVVVQPTRGLDVGAIENIHEKILNEKKMNRGVLLVSYELNEVIALADTIYVVNVGKLIGVVNGKGAKKEEIGRLMTGDNGGIVNEKVS